MRARWVRGLAMKIRTKLVFVFLLVAIIPLTAIVLYSYLSSLHAVRAAVEEDAAGLASRMDDELSGIRADLHSRIARVGELPLGELSTGSDQSRVDSGLEEMVLAEMGPAAPFVTSLELTPAVPGVPAPPAPPGSPAVSAPPPPAVSTPTAATAPMATSSTEVAGLVDTTTKVIADRAARKGRDLTPAEKEKIRAAFEKLATSGIAAVQPVIVKVLTGDGTSAPNATAIEAMKKAAMSSAVEARHVAVERIASEKQRMEVAAAREKARLVLGHEIAAPIVKEGKVVGSVHAQVSADEILARILSSPGRKRGEIPFAVDSKGTLHTVSGKDRAALGAIPIDEIRARKSGRFVFDHWVVATSFDEESGLRLGIARPISDSIETMRKTAVRNFGVGLALILVALFGITPISRRLTREISLVTEGAERIAQGDLDVEVPVQSRDEVGQLAVAFNRMARDLSAQQKRLVEEARLRREQELREHLLSADIERKTKELEDAREFQLSLLPKSLPDHEMFDLAVHMKTATEVGGDYYDFRRATDGSLVVAIGDATGHGAKAGTMVTVVKSLFSAWPAEAEVSTFLAEAARTIKRMDLGRMAMALSIVRLTPDGLTVSAAGMPPILVWRAATGAIEEITVEGMPLGTLSYDYSQSHVPLGAGDTVLMMTDGFPELLNGIGEPFGYPNVEMAFRGAAGCAPTDLIVRLAAAAEGWSSEPSDDMTFVVARRVGHP